MTNLSLKYRIALVIFVLETLMITAVLWTTSTESFLAAKNFQKDQENVFFEVLNELSVTALLTEEFGDVQYFFEQMVQKPDINTAILVDAAGKIVASSKIALIGDDSSPSNNTAIRFWRKMDIESPAGVLGILSIEFSNEALVGTNAKIRNRGITIAVVGMSIILIIGIAVGFALTRRLNKLSIAARAFANGDMRVQSDISGGDEVAELGKTFNEMVKTVAESQALVTKEKEQFQLLLDSTAEAIIGLDNDKRCIFVNQAC
ncbi:MAG: HAMP domain-containing protein, partial [Gammaproteobacteria bacterium]|nr:HAMP domain-containing protein [Gammaproteobacteria bacterium]